MLSLLWQLSFHWLMMGKVKVFISTSLQIFWQKCYRNVPWVVSQFLPYMDMAAILVIWPRPCKQIFVPPSHWGSIWILALIGQAVLEKIFENGGRWTDNGPCYTVSSSMSSPRDYGRGGHLGHVNLFPWTNFRSPIQLRLHMKFGFDFGEDLWKWWMTDRWWTMAIL